jgi:hypothetical protein
VRATGLERHHERLPGGELHRVGQLEDALVQPVEDLQADAEPGLRAGVAPTGQRRDGGGDQSVHVGVRVAHVQWDAEGALLRADQVGGAGLVEREVLAEVGAERGLSLGGRGLPVDPWARRLGKGGPVVAVSDGGQRLVEALGVPLEQRVSRRGRRRCLGHGAHHASRGSLT